MKLEEIIAKLKGENKTDEEIKQAVETLKKEIDDFLNASEGTNRAEEDQAKLNDVFGV